MFGNSVSLNLVATLSFAASIWATPVYGQDFEKLVGEALNAIANGNNQQVVQSRGNEPMDEHFSMQISSQTKMQIQTALNTLGFSVGVADGEFGPATRSAISRWQRSVGLQASGRLTAIQAKMLQQIFVATFKGNSSEKSAGNIAARDNVAVTDNAPNPNLDFQIFEQASIGNQSSCRSGIIEGLKSSGDGFLAVRSGPNSDYTKIHELVNGDRVTIFAAQGKWLGVAFGQSDVTCNSPVKRRVPFANAGWIHRNWVTVMPFTPSEQIVASRESVAQPQDNQMVAVREAEHNRVSVSERHDNDDEFAAAVDQSSTGGNPVVAELQADEESVVSQSAGHPNGGLVPNHVFPGYEFSVLKEHALFREGSGADVVSVFYPWIAWLQVNLPLYAPEYVYANDEEAYAAAYVMLDRQEKQALQEASSADIPLFLEEEKYQIDIKAKRPQHNPGAGGRRHASGMLNHTLDEFTKPTVVELIRETVREKIATMRPQRNLPLVQLFQSSLGEYDFDAQSFELESVISVTGQNAKTPDYSGLGGGMNFFRNGIFGLQTMLRSDVHEFPLSVPLKTAEAKALVDWYNANEIGKYRPVFVGVFSVLENATLEEKERSDNKFMALNTRVTRIEIATDEKLENVIHTFYPEKVGAEDIGKIADAAQSTKPTLYDMQYLAAALAEQVPDMLDDRVISDRLFNYRVLLESADLSLFGLDNSILTRVVRQEVRDKTRKPTIDDRNKFSALLKGEASAGVSDTIRVPFSLSINEDENGNTVAEHGQIKSKVAIIGKALGQASQMSAGRDWGVDWRQEPRGFSKMVPTRQGYQALPAGQVPMGVQTSGNQQRFPVVFYVKTVDSDLYAPLDFLGELKTPASQTTGGGSIFYGAGAPNSVTGHVVLKVTQSIETIDLLRGPEGARAIAITVTPEKIVMNDQGEFLELPMNVELAPASKASPVQVPEILSIDAETSDLLVVRHMPESVTDDDYKRMMLARWHVENEFERRGEAPVWGKFYKLNQPMPDADASAGLLDAFREWSLARAAALPEVVTLQSHANFREPGVFGSGGTLANGNNLNSEVHSCVNKVKTLKNVDMDLRPNQIKMIENACRYIQEASTIPSNISYGSNHYQYLTKQYAERASVTDRNGKVGARVDCGQPLGQRDLYCRGMAADFKEGRHGNAKFALNDVYITGNYLEITSELIAMARQRNVKLQTTAIVENVERTNKPYLSPAAQAVIAADDFLREQGLRDTNNRPAREYYAPELVDVNYFHLKIVTAKLVDTKTGESVAEVPIVDAPSMPDQVLLAPVERVAVTAPKEPYGPDIVGLKLGMTFEQADAKIRDLMDVGNVYRNVRDLSFFEVTGYFSPYKSALAYESTDKREVIILFDEPPVAKDVIVGAVRQLVFEKDTVSPNQIIPQLKEKYGDPSVAEGFNLSWGDDLEEGGFCDSPTTATLDRENWHDANEEPVIWNPGTFRGSSPPAPALPMPDSAKIKKRCGVHLGFAVDTRENKEWDRFIFRLSDRKTYFDLLRESEEMIQNGATLQGVQSKSDAVDIKL